MPSPSLLEWCTTPLTSFQQSMYEFINKCTKRDLEVPSQVIEIQKLDGEKPGDKYKSLNAIVNGIVESVKNGDDLGSHLSSLTPLLLDIVKVNVGVKLQLSSFIVESLKSQDASISRKALKARWFFDGGNPRVTADYFVKDIFPFVSVRTRLDIVKRLAQGLRGHEAKAQEFLTEFVDLYGVQENLPILTVCSENFIFDSILRYKIVLPLKILKILYSSRCGQRDLVVRYLHLSNTNVSSGHEILIHEYDTFIPKLIRHHPQDFVELYELTPEKILPTLSSRRTTWLLANAREAMISRSDIFLKLLEPKVVKRRLSREEMESMLENYLPKDITDFLLDSALDFVDTYCDDIQVLIRIFEKLYSKSLLDYSRKLIESETKSAASLGLKFLRKLPATERENQIKLLLSNIDGGNVEMKHVLMSYTHPNESFPYFKDLISKSTCADDRIRFIGSIIVSCGVQNNKNDLLDVLKYFRDRHANEQNIVLYQFLERLKSEFTLTALDEAHWSVLREIINNARVKKVLFKSHVTLIETVLEAMLRHAMTCQRKNDRHVDEAIDIIVECKVEISSPSWNIFKDNLVLEKECLEKFFMLIPVKYPLEHHSIWKDKNDRLVMALSLLKSIEHYNNQITPKKTKSTKINLKDYPWILKLTEEFISGPNSIGGRQELLKKLVKRQAPEFHEQKLSESSSTTIKDIGNGDAYRLLKRQPDKVLENWLDYLNEARDKLQSSKRSKLDNALEKLRARRFVAATKWHKQLPVKFIEACLSDMKTEGSLIVLGILLPGETFEKISAAYTPKKDNFEMTRAAIEGMKLTNPPVSLESLMPFCRNAMSRSIADGTLTNLARRVTIGSAAEFAKKLASQSQASLMKRGIHLAKIVTTKQQFHDLLAETWTSSVDDVSLRKLIAKMIFDNFVTSSPPHTKDWQLMLTCLRGLTINDKEAVQDLNDIEKINCTEFLSDYVEEYLSKVEEIFAASLDFEWRTKCVCLLVESFDDNLTRHVSEEVNSRILKKYFFDADCTEISRVVRTFAVRYYLLACGDDDKFGSRLSLLVDILKKTSESFDVSHPKKRRYYPANYTMQEFFGGLLSELCASEEVKTDKKLRIVESVLDVLKTSLSPWQEPKSYVSLNLYKDYLLSTTPEDFGIRVAKKIVDLVEDLGSNEPIVEIADCLNDFVTFGKIFRNHKNPFNLKMSLIEGLLQGDEYYGALASTKLLDPNEVVEYDERYDRLIGSLRQMKNSSIQYNLYQHINNLTEQ